jgi:hypothetical protein
MYTDLERAYKGEFSPTQPFRLHQAMGWRLYDVLWDSLIPIFHERVVDLLEGAGLTGWAKYRVMVTDRRGEELAGYRWGLAVHGRCQLTCFSKDHSRVVYEQFPGGLFPRYEGLHVSVDSWDGSDFFLSREGTGYLIVTEPVARVLRSSKVTNVELTPIERVKSAEAKDQPIFPKARTDDAIQ